MTVKWTEASASAVRKTKELVEKYHPQLRDARIGLVFRSEAAPSQGMQVAAKASKVDDKTQALLMAEGALEPVELLIWIAEDVWQRLSDEQQYALIDQELCHFRLGVDGYKIVGHDIEEFMVILERYGLWSYNLLRAKPSMQQAMLPFESSGTVVAVQPEMMPAEV